MTEKDISITEEEIASLPEPIRQHIHEKTIEFLNDLRVPIFTNPQTGEISVSLEKLAEALGMPLNEATAILYGRAN